MSVIDQTVLRHNYHELTDTGRLLYMVAVKPKWDERRQFFFEGCRDLPGQMYVADRQALHDAILRHRPAQCFEVGTFTGGGSTFFLASAFHALGSGRVVTMEADQNRFMLAAGFYAQHLPQLYAHAKFLLGSDPALFAPFIEPERGVEAVFLDGSEDAEATWREFLFFRPHFRRGALLMAHDWNTDKQRLLRPFLEQSADWRCELLIDEPDSVGFAVYVHEPV